MPHKIHNKNILLTAFCNTSAELLLKDIEDCMTLFLPNDKIKDSEMLIAAIANKKFDYVISFGQRPNMKDKVHIETTAKEDGLHINTNFDCIGLKQLFEKNGIASKISYNAGTSFCNKLYFGGLRYISENSLDTKMVFVHIPFEKNITDFYSFRRQVLESVRAYGQTN